MYKFREWKRLPNGRQQFPTKLHPVFYNIIEKISIEKRAQAQLIQQTLAQYIQTHSHFNTPDHLEPYSFTIKTFRHVDEDLEFSYIFLNINLSKLDTFPNITIGNRTFHIKTLVDNGMVKRLVIEKPELL